MIYSAKLSQKQISCAAALNNGASQKSPTYCVGLFLICIIRPTFLTITSPYTL